MPTQAGDAPAPFGASRVSWREWLSRHSVFYRASMHTMIGAWARRVEHALADSATGDVMAANDANRGVRTLLQLLAYAPGINPADPRVRAGLAVPTRVLARSRDLKSSRRMRLRNCERVCLMR